jgi:hypothetical protein
MFRRADFVLHAAIPSGRDNSTSVRTSIFLPVMI